LADWSPLVLRRSTLWAISIHCIQVTPVKKAKGEYNVDNINVVFEAGMLHGRSDVG